MDKERILEVISSQFGTLVYRRGWLAAEIPTPPPLHPCVKTTVLHGWGRGKETSPGIICIWGCDEHRELLLGLVTDLRTCIKNKQTMLDGLIVELLCTRHYE
jgi:hypothetical protein